MSKLKDVIEILDSKRIPLSSKERSTKAKIYPYYGAQGVIDYIDKYIFEGNYILVAEDGNNLKSLKDKIATWVSGKFWVNNHAHILGERKGTNLKYLYYYLNSIDLSCLITGSAQPKLNQENLGNLNIDLPEINIQNKISTILSSIDNKFELNNKINIELEAMAKTIYDYWFLQFEFPNEEGKPYKSSGGKMIWNEELKREIPEGWEVKKLKELFQFIKGKTAKSLVHNQINKDFKPYITIDVANGEIPKYCNDENMIICNGETIMVMDGAASGDIYVGIRGILGSTFAMLLPIDNSISSILIYHILQKYKDIYKKVNTGSTVPHANKDFIGNINVALPKDLSFFNSTFTSISKKIILNKKENRELTSLRDFLLPLLMNGQVGFKDKEDKAEG
jgi:type I restriction enzyme S subunit